MRRYSKYLIFALLLITIVAITGVSAADSDSAVSNTTTVGSSYNVNVLTDDNSSNTNISENSTNTDDDVVENNTNVSINSTDNESTDNGTNITENKTTSSNIDTSIKILVENGTAIIYNPTKVNISVIAGNETLSYGQGDITVIITKGKSTIFNKTIAISNDTSISWIPTSTGNYSIFVQFNGYNLTNTTAYNKSNKTQNITIGPNNNLIIHVKNITMDYRDGTKYFVNVTDSNGNPINKASVRININGRNYYVVTNSKGIAYINLLFAPKTYTVKVYLVNTTNTNSSKVVIRKWNNRYLKVDPKYLSKYYKDSTRFKVYVTYKNKRLINVPVYFVVHGGTHRIVTNSAGIAQININFKPGTYKSYAYVNSNGKKVGKYSTMVIRKWNKKYAKLTVYRLSNKYYADSKMFTVKLTYKNQPINGEIVKFVVRGKTYIKRTHPNGLAVLKSGLVAGTYVGRAYVNVYGVKLSGSNKITVKPAIVNMTIKNKVSTWTVQTEDNKLVYIPHIKKGEKLKLQFTLYNKPRAKQYILVNISGKVNTYKTNSQGYITADTSNAKYGQQVVKIIYYSFDKNFYRLLWNQKIVFDK